MNPKRRDALDERNTAFEPGSPEMVEHRPGFRDDGTRHRNVRGEERFPRKMKESEVPHESLAARLVKPRKGA
jgi:hypothetical protein